VGQVFPSPRARLAALDFLELGRFEGSSPAGEAWSDTGLASKWSAVRYAGTVPSWGCTMTTKN
jgi:hypothetical protein